MPTTSAYAENPPSVHISPPVLSASEVEGLWACLTSNKSEIPSGQGHSGWSPRRELHLDQESIRLKRMRFRVKSGAEYIQSQLSASGTRWYAAMLTCTYREDAFWSPRDISRLTNAIQKYARRKWGVAIPGITVIETTKKGKPHYHLMLWLPSGKRLPMPDRQGWWPHGMTSIDGKSRNKSSGSPVRSAVAYLVKYASKCNSEAPLPRGARISSQFGLSQVNRRKLAWRCLPEYVKDRLGLHDMPTRVRGGGFAPRAFCEYVTDSVWSWGKRQFVVRGYWQAVDSLCVIESPWECLEVVRGMVVLREK